MVRDKVRLCIAGFYFLNLNCHPKSLMLDIFASFYKIFGIFLCYFKNVIKLKYNFKTLIKVIITHTHSHTHKH